MKILSKEEKESTIALNKRLSYKEVKKFKDGKEFLVALTRNKEF